MEFCLRMNFPELHILEQDFKPGLRLDIPSRARKELGRTGLLNAVKPDRRC